MSQRRLTDAMDKQGENMRKNSSFIKGLVKSKGSAAACPDGNLFHWTESLRLWDRNGNTPYLTGSGDKGKECLT